MNGLLAGVFLATLGVVLSSGYMPDSLTDNNAVALAENLMRDGYAGQGYYDGDFKSFLGLVDGYGGYGEDGDVNRNINANRAANANANANRDRNDNENLNRAKNKNEIQDNVYIQNKNDNANKNKDDVFIDDDVYVASYSSPSGYGYGGHGGYGAYAPSKPYSHHRYGHSGKRKYGGYGEKPKNYGYGRGHAYGGGHGYDERYTHGGYDSYAPEKSNYNYDGKTYRDDGNYAISDATNYDWGYGKSKKTDYGKTRTSKKYGRNYDDDSNNAFAFARNDRENYMPTSLTKGVY